MSEATDFSSAFRQCLIDLDVHLMRKLWRHVSPHLPQPKSDEEALVSMHVARTQANTVPEKLRFYSHRWVTDRGLPSFLPDALRPRAERMYPQIAEAVGISINYSSPEMKPAATAISGAMQDAVLEAYEDGKREPEFVSARMKEARLKAATKLFG